MSTKCRLTAAQVLFVGPDRFADIRGVHVVEVEHHRLTVRLDDRPDFPAGTRLEFVDRRIGNQAFQRRAELRAAGPLLAQHGFRRVGRQSRQHVPHGGQASRSPRNLRRCRLPAFQLGHGQERRILGQRAHVVHHGLGPVDGLRDHDIAFRQIEFHRRFGRNLGERPVVGQHVGRFDLAHLHVPQLTGLAHLAERRVVELRVEVVVQRRDQPLDVGIDIRRVCPRALQQLDVLVLHLVDQHVQELLVVQRTAGGLGFLARRTGSRGCFRPTVESIGGGPRSCRPTDVHCREGFIKVLPDRIQRSERLTTRDRSPKTATISAIHDSLPDLAANFSWQGRIVPIIVSLINGLRMSSAHRLVWPSVDFRMLTSLALALSSRSSVRRGA